ncbi:MAG: NTP transferase domain-containing protein [Actinomycetales bacterium]|nr:NTP transferase domain-containing protein [Actinomycetales bacterium]
MSRATDVIVLAGGEARRLGGVAKGEVEVAGRAMLDHVLEAAAHAPAVIIVGPDELARPGVPTVMEHPPRGGPVAGIEAGLELLDKRAAEGAQPPGDAVVGHLDPAPERLVAVLACDVPRAPAALPHLETALAAAPGADGVHLTDGEGRSQLVMLVRHEALRGALARLGDGHGTWGASVKRLVAQLNLEPVPDAWGYGRDADTWEDVRALDALMQEENDGGNRTAG